MTLTRIKVVNAYAVLVGNEYTSTTADTLLAQRTGNICTYLWLLHLHHLHLSTAVGLDAYQLGVYISHNSTRYYCVIGTISVHSAFYRHLHLHAILKGYNRCFSHRIGWSKQQPRQGQCAHLCNGCGSWYRFVIYYRVNLCSCGNILLWSAENKPDKYAHNQSTQYVAYLFHRSKTGGQPRQQSAALTPKQFKKLTNLIN